MRISGDCLLHKSMYIVADIGGTNMRVARSSDLERFDEPIIEDTPPEYERGLALFIHSAKTLAAGETVEGVVVGITGVQNADGVLVSNRHEQWEGRPFAADLARALATKVRLENDTALVGLGEAHFGAGTGAGIVAYYTVSTGVNGVRIVDGAIDKAAEGFEVGGQYLVMGGAAKTLEDLVSGTAIREKYGKAPRDLGKDSPVWEELAEILAYGVHNSILHWSPHRVVLGGSMFKEIGIKPDRVRTHVKSILHKLPTVPDIVQASLGDVGGLYGGLARLRQLRS